MLETFLSCAIDLEISSPLCNMRLQGTKTWSPTKPRSYSDNPASLVIGKSVAHYHSPISEVTALTPTQSAEVRFSLKEKEA
jgi:hypothetical protein